MLLDHVGAPGLPYGYSDGGMNVTLADSGTAFGVTQGNIHSGGGGALAGLYNPDNTSGSLMSFLGVDPDGTWTLFIADTSSGGLTTVQSWGLQIDIVAVPEVEAWIAAAFAGAFGAFWLNRQIWGEGRTRK